MSKLQVIIPFSFEELEPLLKFAEFLDNNQDDLIKQFSDQVINFLTDVNYFPIGVLSEYNNDKFEDLVCSLLAKELSNFQFTPEQILLLCDPELVEMFAGEELFNVKNYLTGAIN